MKWLLAFVFIGLLFVGQASWVEASEGGKSHLQMANEDLATIDQIGKISDPKAQAQAIAEFMRKVQGFGDPVRVEAAKNGLNKYTWNVGGDGDTWFVVYEESKKGGIPCKGGYFAKGSPPEDAQILPTTTIKGVKK